MNSNKRGTNFLSSFLNLKCSGDVQNCLSPGQLSLWKINAAMATLRTVKGRLLRQPNELTLVHYSGGPLLPVLAAHLLPVKKVVYVTGDFGSIQQLPKKMEVIEIPEGAPGNPALLQLAKSLASGAFLGKSHLVLTCDSGTVRDAVTASTLYGTSPFMVAAGVLVPRDLRPNSEIAPLDRYLYNHAGTVACNAAGLAVTLMGGPVESPDERCDHTVIFAEKEPSTLNIFFGGAVINVPASMALGLLKLNKTL